MDQTSAEPAAAPSRVLNILAWVAQLIVAGMFCMAGFMKLTTPIAELSAMMPWTGELSAAVVRSIGAIDLAGGVGILLPALLRIQPRLTVWAAIGGVVLQICALLFHMSRGEFAVTPLNIVLLAACGFVLWVRTSKAPIAPRG